MMDRRLLEKEGRGDMFAAAANRGFCRVRQTVRPGRPTLSVIITSTLRCVCEIHISERACIPL